MEGPETLSPGRMSALSSVNVPIEEDQQQPEHKILIELIEDLDKRRELMRQIEAT